MMPGTKLLQAALKGQTKSENILEDNMNPKFSLVILLSISLLLSACVGEDSPNNYDPNKPVSSDDTPIPVEPDGGIGGAGDEGKTRGNAFVNDAQLMIMESYPVQVSLSVSGDLPTPCNELRYTIEQPDEENRIYVEVYSVIDPGIMCTQVLDPFAVNISLPVQDLPEGTYSVYVNGELVGEFSYPA
jgi:hypothetical protein